MTPERWKRIEELFEAARQFSGEQRAKFLEAQCADDPRLQDEVERLIRIDENAADFLNGPLVQDASLKEGQIVAERYRIGPLLGRGGMGEVYRASDLFLHEDVALKRIRPEFVRDESVARRFQKEIQLARKITHPSVCRVFEAGEQQSGRPNAPKALFFTMELLDGETLSNRIRREGRLSRETAFSIAVQVAEGLAAAHQAGIVHTDFKSGNVILVPQGDSERAVITDFGLARRDPAMLDPEKTRTLDSWQGAGTVAYMSPEQLMGSTLTPASDIYSFGIVLFEMATGRLPFDERLLIRSAMQRADPQTISVRTLAPDIHPFWEQTIQRCLRKNPEDRFKSAVELAEWLHSGRWNWRFWSRREWGRAALASAVLLATGGGLWSWLSRPYRPQPAALDWYEKGRKAMHSMTYEAARKALEQAVSADPMFALAYANLARTYDELDYSDRASELMLDAVSVAQETRLSSRDQLELRALQFMVSGHYERAAPLFRQLEDGADARERSSAALESGWVAQQMEDTEKARKAYERALQLDPNYAAGKLRQGFILGRIGQNDEALGSFAEAERLFGAASDYEGTTETLLQRANLLNRRSRSAEAMTIVDKALGTARTVGNRYQEIRLKLLQGVVARNLRQYTRAAELAQLAVDEALAENMDNLAASGLVDLGNAYLAVSELKKAESIFRQARDFARRQKIRRGEVRAKAALISLYEQDHRPEEAKELAPDVLAFYRQAGYSRDIAQIGGILAGVHAQLGEYEEGIRVSREALAGALRVQDPGSVTRIRARLGLNLSWSGLWPQALEEYLIVAKDAESGLQGRLSRLACARLYWWLGRPQDAAHFIGEAEQALVREPNSQIQSVLQARKAEMAYDEERWSTVLTLTSRGLSAAGREEEAEHSLLLFEALALIRSGRTAQGERKAADLLNILEGDKLVGSLASARLRMADAWAASGNRTMALDSVSKALEFLEPSGIIESVWRAHALFAQALTDSPDVAVHREKARTALRQLKTSWPAESIASYLDRPAIQQLSKEARL